MITSTALRKIGQTTTVAVLLLAFMSAPATAVEEPSPSVGWNDNSDEAISKVKKETRTGGGASGDTGVPQADIPAINSTISYRYERVCLQGAANNLDREVCQRINAACNAEENGILVMWLSVDSSTSPPSESVTGDRSCMYPGSPAPEPPNGGEPVDPPVVITLEDFQSQPIIAAEVVSEPNNFGLLGGHNNVWANVEEQEFTFETLGDEVRIRAWPVEYDWNYGDGTTRSTMTAGNSVPEEDWLMVETPTSHVYEETGDYNLVLTTRFNGDYSVNGGPWIPIAGQATVNSEPHLISIWRSDNRLVDGTCEEDPSAWGCQ